MEALTSRNRASRPWATLALALVLMSVAMYLIRLHLASSLNFETVVDRTNNGFRIGVFLDVVMILLALPLALLLNALTRIPMAIFLALHFTFYWFSSLANAVYFNFFQSRLYWWVIHEQGGDVQNISGSVISLLSNSLLLTSTVLFAASLFLVFREFFHTRNIFRSRIVAVVFSCFSIWLVLFLHQSRFTHTELFHKALATPVDSNEFFSPVREQIQEVWVMGWLGQSGYEHRRIAFANNTDFSPRETLQAFQAYQRDKDAVQLSSKELKAQLGLDPETKPHVLIFFMEGLRSFEFFHPQIGPLIFPRLHQILGKHGVVFDQAYSSSLSAGQTVRGTFSTLCSFMPNLLGPATMILNPLIESHCLQKFLHQDSYHTMWLSTHLKEYHRQIEFERHQQTQYIKDRPEWVQEGLSLVHGAVPDEEFLPVLLREIHAKLVGPEAIPNPLFLHAVNSGTHHPFSSPSSPRLDPRIVEKLPFKARGDYENFLNVLHVADKHYADLFEGLFSGPDGDKVLIVFLADHSTTQDPGVRMSFEARMNMRFHIPLAFLTRNNPTPRVESKVVHQIDIAPTLAGVLGFDPDPSWLGRNILSEATGSPWVFFDQDHGVYFRDSKELCFQTRHATLSCAPNSALLEERFPFEKNVEFHATDPDSEKLKFFKDLIRADHQLNSSGSVQF
jgi:phosphoglycerol transferase MdoB-like AlkP superfamily enzyme